MQPGCSQPLVPPSHHCPSCLALHKGVPNPAQAPRAHPATTGQPEELSAATGAWSAWCRGQQPMAFGVEVLKCIPKERPPPAPCSHSQCCELDTGPRDPRASWPACRGCPREGHSSTSDPGTCWCPSRGHRPGLSSPRALPWFAVTPGANRADSPHAGAGGSTRAPEGSAAAVLGLGR